MRIVSKEPLFVTRYKALLAFLTLVMKQLLLNNDLDNFPTTCGGRGDYTQRLCPCAYKYPNTRVTYHTVFNVQVSFIN